MNLGSEILMRLGNGKILILRIETSQKARRGVHLADLAAYIDKRRAAAVKERDQLCWYDRGTPWPSIGTHNRDKPRLANCSGSIIKIGIFPRQRFVRTMSALPPITDIRRSPCDVRYVPQAASSRCCVSTKPWPRRM